MKRVCFLLNKVDFGGIERMVIDLFKYLKKRKKEAGFEPYLIVFRKEGKFLKELEDMKDVFFLTSSGRKVKTGSLSFYLKLRKLLKELKPDILHFHGYPIDFIGTFASFGLNVKKIAHIHNFHFIGGKRRIKKYRFMSRYIDSFIYVSEAVMKSVDPLYNASCRDRRVLYNFIVPERIENLLKKEEITRKDLGIPDEDIVFCFVGRLTDNKNVINLINAMAYLRDKKGLYLIIVGGGKLESDIRKLVKNLQLTNVVFVGTTTNPYKFLRISDVFILPSLVEGLPIAHLEAMYLGLPALISENVPSKEIAYQASFIVGTSPESIAKGMEVLYDCESLRNRLREKAKEIASNFTIDKYVENLQKVYLDLTG